MNEFFFKCNTLSINAMIISYKIKNHKEKAEPYFSLQK